MDMTGQTMAPAQREWTGVMVTPLSDGGVETQASFVRKHFSFDGGSNATLTISALGLYRCFINGERVGADQLTPGWTCYNERLSYQAYEVSELLRAGDNVIEIWLADGWYRSQMLWWLNPVLNTWGKQIAAIAEIEAGGKTVVATDTSWKSGLLPILKSGIYFGEIYDARLEGLPDDKGTALHPNFDPATLIAHEMAAVKELEPLAVTRSFTDSKGRTIYDFGQNSGGYVDFTVEGKSGARVIVEHAEILDQQGNFNNENLRSAAARLEYVLKGTGPEQYKPAFTFQGFRYARVTIDGDASISTIVSVPISSAIQRTGWLTTGHPLVNRLVENTVWSQRANFIEVPTDCPQRDERLGWTGDAQVFAPTACYLHESNAFFRKWLRDVMADQRADGEIPHVSPDPTRGHEDVLPSFYGSTGWGDAICIVPWVLFTHYGDRGILEETLPAMIRWVDFVWSISDGPIVRPPVERRARGFSFGDWLQPGGPSEKPLPTIGDDAAATIYLFISSALTSKIAGLLGEQVTEKRMHERAEIVRAAFAREFITESGRLAYDDQTSYALAFMHNLIPEGKRAAAKDYFKSTIARSGGRIGTGFIGTPALLPALAKIGEVDLAADVFLQEGVPGWLHQIKNGATTIWERWDAIKADGTLFDPEMNSYNHYAYGAVCQWLFEAVSGLRPDEREPGFKHVIFEPTIIPALSPVRAAHDSVAGRIEVEWRLEDGQVEYVVTVPEGSRGTIMLPKNSRDVSLDGSPIVADGPIAIGSGRYTAKFKLIRA